MKATIIKGLAWLTAMILLPFILFVGVFIGFENVYNVLNNKLEELKEHARQKGIDLE